MYKNGLFYFDLTEEDNERNAEIANLFNNMCVNFGGILLPVTSLIPKQLKFEIKSRNWATRDFFGNKSTTTTVRKNRDGSTTTITETFFTKPDGTRVKETKEVTVDPESITSILVGDTPYNGSLSQLFDAAKVSKRGSFTTSVSTTSPQQFPRSVVRTTVTTPPTSTTEEVVQETTVFDPIAANSSGTPKSTTKITKGKRKVAQAAPKYFQKPVEIVSITGKKYIQYLGVDDRDLAYWNDEMQSNPLDNNVALGVATPGSSENVVEEVMIDPTTNTRVIKSYTETTDADGNVTKVSTERQEPLIDPVQVAEQQLTENNKQVTVNTRSGSTETSVSTTFNKFGAKLNETTTTTTRSPQTSSVTSTEQSSDGTKTVRETVTTTDANGKETVNETETATKNQSTTVVNRSDALNYDENIRTVTLTKTTTTQTGNTVTEEKVFKFSLAQEMNTSETITEKKDDVIADAVVYGHLINEFEISGELFDNDVAQKIMDKNFQHQQAWAMYELLGQQLDLGDRLSNTAKRDIYVDQYKIFTGHNNQSVRSGPVLDRIYLDVFRDEYRAGCVFAPQNGFRIEYIAGTYRKYRWSLVLRVYSTVVKDDFIKSIRALDLPSDSLWSDLADYPSYPGIYS